MSYFFKRLVDLLVSILGITLSWWLIFIAWVIAAIETRSNGFFMQQRVGKDGRIFNIYKIKTMKKVDGIDITITSSNDVRITKSGKFFRDTKIDELPQLWNVFIGDMSIVGPRPDVIGYADKLTGDDRILLTVRPGITGPAQLMYKDEESILSKQKHPAKYNNEVLWPNKVSINKKYIQNWSFKDDIKYIWKTFFN
jgi:lipopolysaccharide/colanic/teichoic acid biosynthesis glycosyltransferase